MSFQVVIFVYNKVIKLGTQMSRLGIDFWAKLEYTFYIGIA